MIYDQGVANMQQNRNTQATLQAQLSSGLRVVKPSDDPVAAAAALDVQQSQALNAQFKLNGDTAKSQLSLEESALGDATMLLQDVKTLAVNAGNPTLTNADRATIANELNNHYQELLAIANRSDSNGQFLFSGYKGATQPFSELSPGNVVYSGDSGQRLAQIGSSRTIPISDAGDAIFQSIKNGNGTFVSAANGANTGSGTIDSGVVTDSAAWNSATNTKDFTIKFNVDNSVAPPSTTYDIIDNVNNVSMLTGAAPAAGPYLRSYVTGSAISLKTQSPPDTNPVAFDYGAIVTISGQPAGGDTFTVAASSNQDVFTMLHNLISSLQIGNNTSATTTAVGQNALNTAMSGIDNALNNVLSVRADVGARLKEIDTAQTSSDDLSIQYSATLSGLRDLDYTKAISDLSQQQVYLQAAQQSFLKITSLNLFSLL
jgi:flagellar hook-associated protein 3 FlgL